jgi:hypothetical protein
MSRFKIRFTKAYTLDVEAESLEAAEDAARAAARTNDPDDMAGDAYWEHEVWSAPEWAQTRRPHAVIRNGEFLHPDDVKP